MALPEIVSRQDWLAARKALLEKEKAQTRARDALNAERRMLPMVRIDKDYRFKGPDGPASLRDLFGEHRQLIVTHFMFHPDWENGCSSCSAGADELSEGLLRHLAARDTAYTCISRAPYAKLAAYKAKKRWTFPWYSSFGSDFNYDFGATVDESRGASTYNYRTRQEHEKAGTGYYFGEQPSEHPGVSCFLRLGEEVFHTYSTFGRGDEAVGGAYYWLDLTALGRQEEWEEPKGRVESAHAAMPNFAE